MNAKRKGSFAVKWTMVLCLGFFSQTLNATIIHLESDTLVMGVTATMTIVDPALYDEASFFGPIFNRDERIVSSVQVDDASREQRQGVAGAEAYSYGFTGEVLTDRDCISCPSIPRSGFATAFFSLEWIFSVDGEGASIQVEDNGYDSGAFFESYYSVLLYDITDDEVDRFLTTAQLGMFDLENGHQYLMAADAYVRHSSDTRESNPTTIRFHNSLVKVPEPGTLALLGIGLLGRGAARRMKQLT